MSETENLLRDFRDVVLRLQDTHRITNPALYGTPGSVKEPADRHRLAVQLQSDKNPATVGQEVSALSFLSYDFATELKEEPVSRLFYLLFSTILLFFKNRSVHFSPFLDFFLPDICIIFHFLKLL